MGEFMLKLENRKMSVNEIFNEIYNLDIEFEIKRISSKTPVSYYYEEVPVRTGQLDYQIRLLNHDELEKLADMIDELIVGTKEDYLTTIVSCFYEIVHGKLDVNRK